MQGRDFWFWIRDNIPIVTVLREGSLLRKTPLNQVHHASGARMINFGGWEMPVEYRGIITEHTAVRTGVGLFDVSHMGEITVHGPQSLDLIDYLCSNRAANLENGQAQYSGLLNPAGGFVDDLLVHRMGSNHYFLCVNAGTQEKDYDWLLKNNSFDAAVELVSDKYAQLAIQGPKALEVASQLTESNLYDMRYYWFKQGDFAGVEAIIARTGYTGEDGVEVYLPAEEAERIWQLILDAGQEYSIQPCGLGARNTLRLEAAMSLYGHEINEDITPYEAGLGWIVKLVKPSFCGRETLAKQKEGGITRKIAGFEMLERGIARDDYRVHVSGKDVGWVTSGSPAPYLQKNIGMCMLPVEYCEKGQQIKILIRGREVSAVVVPIPFYKRRRN